MALLLWTTALGGIALIASPEIDRRIPQLMGARLACTYGRPASGLYDSVVVDGAAFWRQTPATLLNQVVVKLNMGSTPTRDLHIDLQRERAWYASVDGSKMHAGIRLNDPSASQVILDWFSSHGVDSANAKVRYEADVIADALDTTSAFQFAGGRIRSFGTKSSSSSTFSHSSGLRKGFATSSSRASLSSEPDPYKRPFIAAGWLALWLVGVAILLLWLRFRRVGAPLATIPASPMPPPPRPLESVTPPAEPSPASST
jgi:hypothetical protein